MLAAGGTEGAIDLWKGRSNNLQPSMSVPRESHKVSGKTIKLFKLVTELILKWGIFFFFFFFFLTAALS